jgi:protein involved in polysaccharide export with SLBB domain
VLYDRLGRVYSGIRRSPTATTHFSIIVVRLRTNQVYVVGDVVAPGAYQISSAGTAMTALYAALGPSINGSLRRIQIRRGGKTVDSLDVYDYLVRGDASHDVRLQSGDIVFVPVHGSHVKVTGEIVRPAIYELKPGETLGDAIRDAGGFSATASRRRVQITRILPPEQRTQPGHDRVVIDVTADALTAETGPALPMEPGDSVAVFSIAPRIRDRLGAGDAGIH